MAVWCIWNLSMEAERQKDPKFQIILCYINTFEGSLGCMRYCL